MRNLYNIPHSSTFGAAAVMAMCVGKEVAIYTWWLHLLDNRLQANATRAHIQA